MDDSGEDYLYPLAHFALLAFSTEMEETFDSIEHDEILTFTHASIQSQVLHSLSTSLQTGFSVLLPVTFQGHGTCYTPDVVVYPKRTTPRDKASREYRVEQAPPLLAVEIISPDQTMFSMVQKCSEMLESSVEECWIIEPANETITVCRKDTQFVRHRGEVLECSLCTRPLTVDEIFDI
jgi:Uma2 family endonuclease